MSAVGGLAMALDYSTDEQNKPADYYLSKKARLADLFLLYCIKVKVRGLSRESLVAVAFQGLVRQTCLPAVIFLLPFDVPFGTCPRNHLVLNRTSAFLKRPSEHPRIFRCPGGTARCTSIPKHRRSVQVTIRIRSLILFAPYYKCADFLVGLNYCMDPNGSEQDFEPLS